MTKRVSMKGMGADAFLPTKSEIERPQDDKTPSFQSAKPASRQNAKQSKQQKVTVYLPLEHLMKLERIRLQRLADGKKVDRSALIAEAIDQLPEP